MSIQKEYGLYTPTCDICGETLMSEHDFYDAVSGRKKAGWKGVKQQDGQWTDMCNECFVKETEEYIAAYQ